jgi:hypothetical protein
MILKRLGGIAALLLALLLSNAQASDLRFTDVPPSLLQVDQPADFAWTAEAGAFRYKLDVPGDWQGGVRHALEKWSDWGPLTHVVYDGFVRDGRYELTVEARSLAGGTSRISYAFTVRHFVSEAGEAEPEVDWAAVSAGGSQAERCRILASEFSRVHDAWMAEYEGERRELRLATSGEELLVMAGGALRDKFIGDLQEDALDTLLDGADRRLAKGAFRHLKRAFLPKRVYDILKAVGLNGVLIWQNIETNRAAVNAIITGWAAEYYGRCAEGAPTAVTGSPDHHAVELILLLDSSGSMADNDPFDFRRRAAQLLLENSPGFVRFGLFEFASEVSRLGSGADRDSLIRDLSRLSASGGTNLCKALQAGLETEGFSSRRRAIVLLTDGMSQDSCGPGDFAGLGTAIFTVGLSQQSNGEFLDALASGTGGKYFHARTSADLQEMFDSVLSAVLDEPDIISFDGIAMPGERLRIPFVVDGTLTSLSATLTWPGSDLDLSLIRPDGSVETSFERRTVGATYESIRIDRPQPGRWVAMVESIDVAPEGEPFRFRAGGASPVRLSVERVSSGSTASMVARLEGASGKTPSIEARVRRPDGLVEQLIVATAADGVRATYGGADRPGPYEFHWTASAGDVTRSVRKTLFVGEAVESRNGLVTHVEGQYVRWDRGSHHGMKPGVTVVIQRGGTTVAHGLIIDVRDLDSEFELAEVFGTFEVTEGDRVVADEEEWIADRP